MFFIDFFHAVENRGKKNLVKSLEMK